MHACFTSSVDILDDMLAGVGWTMQDYLKYGENDYYPPLPNGHRLFLHDIRRVAVRCAVAMGEEGDMVVSTWSSIFFSFLNTLRYKQKRFKMGSKKVAHFNLKECLEVLKD